MGKRPNLDHWYRFPASITGKDLLAEALKRGWMVTGGKGDHVVLSLPGFRKHLTIDLGTRADGTKRNIIRTMQEVDNDQD